MLRNKLISRLVKEGFSHKTLSTFTDPQLKQLARKIIKERGGKSPGSVSAKTTYLLAGEGGGSKLDQAEKFNVPVIDEIAFEHLVINGDIPK